MSFSLIRRVVLESPASDIVISDIPQNFTDLQIVYSLRNSTNSNRFTTLQINGDTASNYAFQLTQGDSGSSLIGYGATLGYFYLGDNTGSSHGANVFSNGRYTIMDYTSSRTKMILGEAVAPNTSTSLTYTSLAGGRWSGTNPVTSIRIADGGGSFVAGSSVSVYGVVRKNAIGKPKAIGGNITYANGYWVHTFTGSGTFYAQQDLNVEALVVAGGGGGGGAVGNGGGGGAGGVLTTTGTILKGSATPVMVGAGGAGMQPLQVASLSNGYNSQFLSAVAIGGGGGGGYNGAFANAQRGANGGSGGGAWSWASQGGAKGLGTQGQGNDGGLPTVRPGDYAEITGGGGGAGAVGGNGSSTTTGNGGDGIFWNGAYYGGGGGGGGPLQGTAANTYGLGGLGGGGNGGQPFGGNVNGTPGVANTGGGGGGNSYTSTAVNPQYAGSGGSGVVIIRYPAAEIRSAELAQPGVQYKIDPLTIQGAWTFATSENATYGGHTTDDYGNVGTVQSSTRKWTQYAGALQTARADANNSGMRLSSATNWTMSNEETIELWVHPISGGNLGRLFTWGNRQDNASTLIDRIPSTGQLLVRTNTGLASTTGYALDGQWSWVVMSKRGSELRVFVNGIQVYYNANGDGSGYTTDGRYFTLGADWDSGYTDAPRFSGAAYWQDVIAYNAAPFHSMLTIPLPTMPLTDRII